MKFFKKKNTENARAAAAAVSGPENPYLAARAEWLERYGSYIARAAQWRAAAFITLSIALLSMAINVIQVNQLKIVPYIVAVDSVGQTKAIDKVVSLAASQVPREVIQSDIINFIINWRSVTPDKDLQKRMIDRLSMYVSGTAKGFMKDFYAGNNPFERAAKYLIAVEPKGLPQPVSNHSWRVEWVETSRSHAGTVISAVSYEATLTIAITPPKNEEEILNNPCGIMVTNINSNRIIMQ